MIQSQLFMGHSLFQGHTAGLWDLSNFDAIAPRPHVRAESPRGRDEGQAGGVGLMGGEP